jgi:hypothetical protein
MREQSWLTADENDLLKMAAFAAREVSARKLRLFAVGSCRLIWNLIPQEQCKEAVAVAEAFADGETTKKALTAARVAVRKVVRDEETYWKQRAAHACLGTVQENLLNVVHGTPIHARGAAICRGTDEWRQVSMEIFLVLLRDVVGPLPFRKTAMKPTWLTSDVTALARTMYETREFSAMPILADALQDAGCDSNAILDHCRGPGPHVRGCWVVDLILGKE